MKILFTGTTCSGKTTVIENLKNYGGAYIIEEFAQKMIAEDASIGLKPEFQSVLWNLQTNAEKQALENSQVVICDRGIVDNIAHSIVLGHEVDHLWLEWSKTYDRAFLFDYRDIQTSDRPDWRPEDPSWVDFRINLHNATEMILRNLSIPYILVSGDVKSRIELITNEIGLVRQKDY